mmetsp:Transcript_30452/g.70212  ORF Transcript_30452/g.70212 Transcript_30452/m.70212 type:complete len:208 (+) Transcript_30452:1843-2466(+)
MAGGGSGEQRSVAVVVLESDRGAAPEKRLHTVVLPRARRKEKRRVAVGARKVCLCLCVQEEGDNASVASGCGEVQCRVAARGDSTGVQATENGSDGGGIPPEGSAAHLLRQQALSLGVGGRVPCVPDWAGLRLIRISLATPSKERREGVEAHVLRERRGRAVELVLDLGVGAVVEQQLDHVRVPLRGSEDQRSVPVVPSSVNQRPPS